MNHIHFRSADLSNLQSRDPACVPVHVCGSMNPQWFASSGGIDRMWTPYGSRRGRKP